jgi:hypothetical protein
MKNSFLLYCDSLEIINQLTDEQKGKLLTRIFTYNNGLIIPSKDKEVELVFTFFRVQFDRDGKKYEDKVEKRKLAGKL